MSEGFQKHYRRLTQHKIADKAQGELQMTERFQFKFSQEALAGIEPVPEGLYEVQFVGFKPAPAKIKPGNDTFTSINLNLEVQILNRPDLDFKNGKPRTVRYTANTSIPSFLQDFVHSFGLPMENQLSEDPNNPPTIPGFWDKDKSKFDASKPETYVYEGPLEGRTAEWELGIREWQGKPMQYVKRFVCKVPDCAIKYPKVQHVQLMKS